MAFAMRNIRTPRCRSRHHRLCSVQTL